MNKTTLASFRMAPAAAGIAVLLAVSPGSSALAQTAARPINGFVMQPTANQVEAPREASAAQRVSSKFDAAFERADRDGDGRLNRQEVEHFPALSQRFDQIDSNRDAFISRDEFNSAASN